MTLLAYAHPARAEPTSARLPAAIGRLASDCLLLEIETYPKPGLVSHVDSGSHRDMDADMFRHSAAAIAPFFSALAEAGEAGRNMGRLRVIGLDAEAAMMKATGGINTHRGAIFGLGLLCAAAGAQAAGRFARDTSLGCVVRDAYGPDILDGPVLLRSHGEEARRRHGALGARAEAAAGFPSLYRVALPALDEGRRMAPGDEEAARVQCCIALMAVVEDTNLLYRGGPRGLAFVRAGAAAFLCRGGVGLASWRADAQVLHEAVVARWLSPGGSADLLAMALFVDALDDVLAGSGRAA